MCRLRFDGVVFDTLCNLVFEGSHNTQCTCKSFPLLPLNTKNFSISGQGIDGITAVYNINIIN